MIKEYLAYVPWWGRVRVRPRVYIHCCTIPSKTPKNAAASGAAAASAVAVVVTVVAIVAAVVVFVAAEAAVVAAIATVAPVAIAVVDADSGTGLGAEFSSDNVPAAVTACPPVDVSCAGRSSRIRLDDSMV